MKIYKIAHIYIAIQNFGIADSVWGLFLSKNNGESNVYIEIINNLHKGLYWNLEYFNNIGNIDLITRHKEDIMIVNNNWKKAYIFPLREEENKLAFIIQMFYTHAVKDLMIQIHSSLIQYNEKGILFLGPSGIGKTTQAELWNKYRDALIINGDMVFVQETENCFLGWGTPWHGSSPYCENTSVPIHAMIVLKQAPDNSIRELTGFEKVTTVSNSVFYPQWLENGMELCLETLDHLLTKVPVYELSCRPDEEAVTLTEQFIF